MYSFPGIGTRVPCLNTRCAPAREVVFGGATDKRISRGVAREDQVKLRDGHTSGEHVYMSTESAKRNPSSTIAPVSVSIARSCRIRKRVSDDLIIVPHVSL